MTEAHIAALRTAVEAFIDHEGSEARYNEAITAVENAIQQKDFTEQEMNTLAAAKGQAFAAAEQQFDVEDETYIVRHNGGVQFLVQFENGNLSISRFIVVDI